MKKILCTLPNASESINGIAFEPTLDGMQSVEAVGDEVAAHFDGITGYQLIEVKVPAADTKKSKPSATTVPVTDDATTTP